MNPLRLFRKSLILAISLLLAACSTITVKHYATGYPPPLCNSKNTGEKLIVFWGTAWRGDQKEVARRSALAAKHIEVFFRSSHCFEVLDISRTVAGTDALSVTDTDVIEAADSRGADRAYVIRLEEFGPNLMFYLSPILWQTQNEVLVRIRSTNVANRSLEADITVHWFRGGPFTIHSAKNLPIDLKGVLTNIFFGSGAESDQKLL